MALYDLFKNKRVYMLREVSSQSDPQSTDSSIQGTGVGLGGTLFASSRDGGSVSVRNVHVSRNVSLYVTASDNKVVNVRGQQFPAESTTSKVAENICTEAGPQTDERNNGSQQPNLQYPTAREPRQKSAIADSATLSVATEGDGEVHYERVQLEEETMLSIAAGQGGKAKATGSQLGKGATSLVHAGGLSEEEEQKTAELLRLVHSRLCARFNTKDGK